MKTRDCFAAQWMLLAALSSSALAQTVQYDSQGFEAPTFSPGILPGSTLFDGQDGWLITGDGSASVDRSLIQVQGAVVNSGSQAVEMISAGQTSPWGHLRRNTVFAVTPGEPVVDISLDMRIDSSATKTDAWGLQGQAGPGPGSGIFIWDVFTDDHVHMLDGGNFVDTGFVFARDQWHRAVTSVDYQAQEVSLRIDGNLVGSVPALSGAISWFFGFSSIYYGIPGDDRMYIDNFEVTTHAQSSGGGITRYCQSGPNSTGQASSIDASGSASLAANDLVLTADHLPGAQPGLFYFGDAQALLAFGNGLRCVGGATVRLPVVHPVGGQASYAPNWNQLPGGAVILAGETRNFQYWYRDPAAGGLFFDTSDALSIVFQP